MLNTPHPKEYLECAGSERWATVDAKFLWGPHMSGTVVAKWTSIWL